MGVLCGVPYGASGAVLIRINVMFKALLAGSLVMILLQVIAVPGKCLGVDDACQELVY